MELNIEKFEEIEKFWGDRMPMMAIEELSELTQAISKCERHGVAAERKNLVDELGDVLISVMCIVKHYGIDESEIERRIEDKTKKKYEKNTNVSTVKYEDYETEVSNRVLRAYMNAGYKIEDLLRLDVSDLMCIRNIGRMGVNDLLALKEKLEKAK